MIVALEYLWYIPFIVTLNQGNEILKQSKEGEKGFMNCFEGKEKSEVKGLNAIWAARNVVGYNNYHKQNGLFILKNRNKGKLNDEEEWCEQKAI